MTSGETDEAMEFTTIGGLGEVPRILIGCWQLAEDHRADASRSESDIECLIGDLVRARLHTFDMADIYTGVEARFGRFRRRWLAAGNEPGSLRLHTKLVPDRSDLEDFGAEDVEHSVDRSRKRLGVDQLDLVQLHWWDFDVPGWLEACRALDRLRTRGWIREIGVTNFDAIHLAELIEAGMPIASNQVQYSLLDRRPATQLADLCRRHDISLLAYGTLAGGFLSERWLGQPDPGFDLHNRSLTKYRLIIDENGGWERFQALLHVLSAIAERKNVSIANVALRWVLDQPQVSAAIVGISNLERTLQHRRTFAIGLEPLDRQELGAAAGTGPRGSVYALERTAGGRHAVIMRTHLNRNNR